MGRVYPPPRADTRQITNYHTSLSRPYQHPTRLYAGTAKPKKKMRHRRESRPRNEKKKRRPETKKRDKRTPGLVHASCRICEIAEPHKGSIARQMRHVTARTQSDKNTTGSWLKRCPAYSRASQCHDVHHGMGSRRLSAIVQVRIQWVHPRCRHHLRWCDIHVVCFNTPTCVKKTQRGNTQRGRNPTGKRNPTGEYGLNSFGDHRKERNPMGQIPNRGNRGS